MVFLVFCPTLWRHSNCKFISFSPCHYFAPLQTNIYGQIYGLLYREFHSQEKIVVASLSLLSLRHHFGSLRTTLYSVEVSRSVIRECNPRPRILPSLMTVRASFQPRHGIQPGIGRPGIPLGTLGQIWLGSQPNHMPHPPEIHYLTSGRGSRPRTTSISGHQISPFGKFHPGKPVKTI